MEDIKIAVIGGSGLYDIEGFTGARELNIDTPFGKPSDVIVVGELGGVGVAFLPRHGKGHRIPPTEVPVPANIYALKTLGVEHIIAVNAVGSLKKELKPGDLVIPDQIIDRTRGRANTFFRHDIVAHVAFAEPFCSRLSGVLFEAGEKAGATMHRGGTYVVMEGPAFSTKAESNLYRSWGADVIGMTALPEAKLAREAEMCYSLIACVTDYDCWHEEHASVTVGMILETLRKNVEMGKKIVGLAIGSVAGERTCQCGNALATAIVTNPKYITVERKKQLSAIIVKYIK
ncbi:S-methyl-5'-thioadenosine phosphorylase [Chloroflexota bacterium]